MPSLEAVPFASLILSLHRERFSGWLEVRREDLRRRIELRAGEPVRIESSEPRESLREHLAGRGLLRAHEVSRVAAGSQSPGGELAAVVRLQAVPPRELLLALASHVGAGLADCVGWSEGSFSLEPDPSNSGGPAFRLPLDLPEVVCQALAQAWPAEWTLAQLGPRGDHFPTASRTSRRRLASLAEADRAEELLQALDGTRSARQILLDLTHPRVHAALFCLDALHELAWAEQGAGSAMGAEPEIEILVAGSPAGSRERQGRQGTGRRASGAADETQAEALRKRIVELRGRLGEMDHYALLGVDRKATPAAIKRAYLQLAKQLHPDAVARQGLAAWKAEAQDVFAEISKAHDVLCDAELRRSYDASLEGHSALDAQKLAQAETLFRKGEVLLKAGQFQGALELLEAAVQLWPEDGTYQAALGWALFKKTPPDLARAREHLAQAVAMEPRSATAYLRLHLVSKAAGDADAAAAALARARAIDPQAR